MARRNVEDVPSIADYSQDVEIRFDQLRQALRHKQVIVCNHRGGPPVWRAASSNRNILDGTRILDHNRSCTPTINPEEPFPILAYRSGMADGAEPRLPRIARCRWRYILTTRRCRLVWRKIASRFL